MPNLVNLSGGLFATAHVTAPVNPEPEVIVPNRAAAVAQARRAHRAARVVGAVAGTILVGGLAAAGQVAPRVQVHEDAPTAAPTPIPPRTNAPRRGAVVAVAPESPRLPR